MNESQQAAPAPPLEGDEPDTAHPRLPLFGPWAISAFAVIAVLLMLCAIAAWRTGDAMAGLSFLRANSNNHGTGQALVDQTPWQTAASLAAMATTQEELTLARQAERLADHDVDQAFAAALRAAALRQHAVTGEALALEQKVAGLTAQTASDDLALKQAGAVKNDDTAILEAQLGLDQDELADARADLARALGDQRGEIQQELVAREAEMKKFDATGGTGEGAVVVARRYRTLSHLLGAWQGQRERLRLILEAQTAAQRMAATFVAQHATLAKQAQPQAATQPQTATQPQAAGQPQTAIQPQTAGQPQATADRVARLKRLSLQRQLLSLYDDRTQSQQQLAGVYGKWAAQVRLQHRIVAHLIALQLIYVLLIGLVAILLGALLRTFAERERLDGRRMRTLGRLVRLGVQVLALIAMLLVIFGPPARISTVIGLATAGLTVALQDFILAFVGWFLLMGRGGIGVGDVVEINAVTGEVVDIGLFRTTLLETGNWTAKGHPTGRRVAFNNRYAISGQFFNFSTTGQWMWDEITLSVAAGQDTGAVLERVQHIVDGETERDAQLAEAEWKRVYARRGLSQFSAKPDVALRPTAAGSDLIVRYVTRAGDRFERRKTLYSCVLEAMQKTVQEATPA